MSEPKDVVYQRQHDREFLCADGSGPFSTVVDVHRAPGTSATAARKAVMHVAMAAAGIIVAALDFRQSQHAPYRASILEINLGVLWVKANAHRFNGTQRVGAWAAPAVATKSCSRRCGPTASADAGTLLILSWLR
jgi:hypothetical protein